VLAYRGVNFSPAYHLDGRSITLGMRKISAETAGFRLSKMHRFRRALRVLSQPAVVHSSLAVEAGVSTPRDSGTQRENWSRVSGQTQISSTAAAFLCPWRIAL